MQPISESDYRKVDLADVMIKVAFGLALNNAEEAALYSLEKRFEARDRRNFPHASWPVTNQQTIIDQAEQLPGDGE